MIIESNITPFHWDSEQQRKLSKINSNSNSHTGARRKEFKGDICEKAVNGVRER